ncbi:holo-ACP synthase [Streptomyces sp. NPDC020996]|uniref:holo-ACP synthase n=1 Tax=Streptomyces sp. NPDC020996 TaxID=3154791 RepID=UPI0033C88B56
MRLGVDLLDVARFGRIAGHPRGRRMVFTAAELAEAEGLAAERAAEFLAGRFCAKEATAKALGRGLGQGLGWRDIEVLRDEFGAPRVRLGGGARAVAERQGVGEITLSLSHHGGWVVAAAIALPAPGAGPGARAGAGSGADAAGPGPAPSPDR